MAGFLQLDTKTLLNLSYSVRKLGRYWYLRLRRRRSTPDRWARGLAAGVFTGMFPIFGFQIVLAVLLSTCIRGDKLVAALGTWVSNPLTYVPIYTFNYQVGSWLLGTKEQFVWQGKDLWSLGKSIVERLFLGSFLVAVVSALLGYGVGLWFFQRIRRKA
jgi:uncharacterized protein (DUF2062 family)